MTPARLRVMVRLDAGWTLEQAGGRWMAVSAVTGSAVCLRMRPKVGEAIVEAKWVKKKRMPAHLEHIQAWTISASGKRALSASREAS